MQVRLLTLIVIVSLVAAPSAFAFAPQSPVSQQGSERPGFENSETLPEPAASPIVQPSEPVSAVVRARAPHLPQPYHLGPGDMLAIIVHGVIGKFGKAPVYFPKPGQDFLPATGYPVQIQDDGKLHLPSIAPVNVTGMSVAQARQAVEAAYLQSGELQQPHRTMLALLRKRTSNVTVIHDDSARGFSRVDKVSLTSDQADLLGALAAGGTYDPHASVRVFKPVTDNPQDGELSDGDVVLLQSPAAHYFTTGGLIPGGRHRLPPGRSITALQAIALAGGTRQGVIPPHRLTIVRHSGPALQIPMREVLRNPAAYLVHSGDHLIVH